MKRRRSKQDPVASLIGFGVIVVIAGFFGLKGLITGDDEPSARTSFSAPTATLIRTAPTATGANRSVLAPPTGTVRAKAPPTIDLTVRPTIRPTTRATVATAQDHPANATAKCRDGTYSYSASHSGACSHHDGVSVWYK